MSRPPEQHKCPHRACDTAVSNHLFSCPMHWMQLPGRVRIEIARTRGQSLLSRPRQHAIEQARKAWEDLP